MPVNFDLNDLYAFRALVEYGNFRVAAESICLSQSALSRRIEKLEAALGNRLFDRTTRRVALTLYGQNFAERSAQLLDSVESMLADVDKASEERTGLIAVAAVPSAACYFMPDVIRRFQSRYPRVRIKLIDSSAGNVIDAVARSQADFGICFAGNLPSEIEFFPLVEDVYVAACRKDHPVAQKSHLTWQAFYQQDYISLDKTSGNRNLLDRMLGDIIPGRPSVCETRHVTTMLGMVEAGIGIAAV
ncbi:LysR family transcriptional regulator, partial [Enterobacter sp. SST3]